MEVAGGAEARATPVNRASAASMAGLPCVVRLIAGAWATRGLAANLDRLSPSRSRASRHCTRAVGRPTTARLGTTLSMPGEGWAVGDRVCESVFNPASRSAHWPRALSYSCGDPCHRDVRHAVCMTDYAPINILYRTSLSIGGTLGLNAALLDTPRRADSPDLAVLSARSTRAGEPRQWLDGCP